MIIGIAIAGVALAIASNAVVAATFWSLGASYGSFASPDEN
ncbi:MAG TPA: hypothetical protein V6D19_21445 [Stenomitos sp.]